MTTEELDTRVKVIEERNKKVEVDKAWETSIFRKVVVAIFTYLAIGIYMWAIGIDKSWLNAIIPSTGFLLSTLTLPFFKSLWEKYIRKN